MRVLTKTLLLVLLPFCLVAAEKRAPQTPPKTPPAVVATPAPAPAPATTDWLLRELRYDGQLSANEARFVAELDLETSAKGEVSVPLFEGDVAVLTTKLPNNLRLVRTGSQYRLLVARAGRYQLKLDLVAKITRAEPWNQVGFTGPLASIASVTAQTSGTGMELQLLSGTPASEASTADAGNKIHGFLGPDRQVAIRWQSKTAEAVRQQLLTCETVVAANLTPNVVKYTTELRYEILQGTVAKLNISLPAAQAITRIQGEQIRDWQVKPDGDRQSLTVEFIKPLTNAYKLLVFSEQTIDDASARLFPPQPQVERETGWLSVYAEDVLVDTDTATGVRQVNAPTGAATAYQFFGRNAFALALKLRRIEPVIQTHDRVTARLEETRLLVTHSLNLNVEKAGVYSLELTPQPGFTVAEVRGAGVEDWKTVNGKLLVTFASRVLGARPLEVQLEQSLKTFLDRIDLLPLRVAGATKETAQIGAASIAGVQLKTGEMNGVREVPITTFAVREGETLAYLADQPDWSLKLSSERQAARITAEIFNLVTVGDGLLGGSATIRYGIINQGVQEFRVLVPAEWKNVEFTGPNIRRKEQQTNLWTISLQDKAWGGYTLVVTYDAQFDPHKATLPLGGAHAIGVERENGTLAITSAADLQLAVKNAADPLRRIDEAELSATDRALISRPVLLAFQYEGDTYDLSVDVARFAEVPVLAAVADRTQITTVLTEEGQMLTQASFMVKNNDKQFQRFTLPKGANFWGCYVGNQPVKAERDGDALLVPLPRGANRDEAFAVDIVYAQKMASFKTARSQAIALEAPKTDVPNTYNEWELYVPPTHRLSEFGGNMIVQRGTTYDLHDAWQQFLRVYQANLADVVRMGGFLLFVVALCVLVITFMRRGWRGALGAAAVLVTIAVIGAIALPSMLSHQKRTTVSRLAILEDESLAQRLVAGRQEPTLPTLPPPVSLEGARGDQVRALALQTNGQIIIGGAFTSQNGTTMNRIVRMNDDGTMDSSFNPNGARTEDLARARQAPKDAAKVPEAAPVPDVQSGAINSLSLGADRPVNDVVVRANGSAGNVSVDFATTDGISFSGANYGLSENGGRAASISRRGGLGGDVSVAGTNAHGTAIAAAMGGGGQPGLPAVMLNTIAAPAVSGIRPLHIDIPRLGERLVFTKVLNVKGESLAVQTLAMEAGAWRMTQAGKQLAAFLIGLVVCFWQWRRAKRNSFLLTLGLALMVLAIGNLLLEERLLHWVFVGAAPLLALVLIVLALWRLADRLAVPAPAPAPEPHSGAADSSAAATATLIAFMLFMNGQASAATKPAPLDTNAVAITTANYVVDVKEKTALVEAVIDLTVTRADQRVPLFGAEVAVQEFSSNQKEARLLRDGRNVGVLLPRRGNATVTLKFLVKHTGDITKRQLAFAIPPALISKLNATLDEPDAGVEVPTAVSFKVTPASQQTKLEAVIGAGERVEFSWTPRVKRAAEIAATVFSQNATLMTFSGGVVHVRTLLDYQVTQGELRQMRVKLPAGQKLMRVNGAQLRTWKVAEENGEQVLAVELTKGVTPGYRLTLELEQLLPGNAAELVKLDVPHAIDVKRESGLLALKAADDLSLTPEATRELQKVDASEFMRAAAEKIDGLTGAYRFLKPGFDLAVRVETLQPQIETLVRNVIRIGTEQLSIGSQVDYTIKRAGVFALRLALPAGFRVETVTGDKILQWDEKKEPGVLEVTLKERVLGAYLLSVTLTKVIKDLPPSLELPGVHPLGAKKINGYISVSAEDGVQIKTGSFEGLTEIPAAQLPGVAVRDRSAKTGVLAYKFLNTEPSNEPGWKLAVATEKVDAWVRAEVVNWVTVRDTLVSGRTLVRYEIANAPTKEFSLRVPKEFKNVEITGADIRRRDHTDDQWRVELQHKRKGDYLMTVTWEMPWNIKDKKFPMPGVALQGVDKSVERETGTFVFIARAPLQVAEDAASTDLLRIDPGEAPEWAGRITEPAALAYRYLRPGYQLSLAAQRFAEADVLQTLIESAQLSTVVSEDGQMMTEMRLAVRNNGRQFLEITLPSKEDKIWSTFVAGEAVRPTLRDGKLLVPLERTSANEGAVMVELTYVSASPFPKGRGELALASPKLDVPLKNARWELFLPPDYRYEKFAGSMSRELAAEPALASFSFDSYSHAETEKRTARKAEVANSLSNARGYLASGNVKEANEYLNRAKVNLQIQDDDGEVKQLKELDVQLRRKNADNLIAGQNAVTLNYWNGNNIVPQQQLQQPLAEQRAAMPLVAYDVEAAEQQWTKLQQAQEVAVNKVLPLRVNLPQRGLRYAFSQVLQTEVGREMTIRFSAADTRAVNWNARIAAGVVGFLLLWGMIAAAQRRPRAEMPAAA